MGPTKYSMVSFREKHSSRPWMRSAAQFQALSMSICFVVFTCFVVSTIRGGAVGTTELFSGQCSDAVNINRALQAVLALLAIGISVSFDFFMRLASSPTMNDLREAHSQGESWDIAVHSLRNVRHISRWRTFGWITLILVAIPIQLLSHSIAFMAFSTTGYSRFFVSEAFTTGQPFAYPGVALLGSALIEDVSWQFHEVLPSFETGSSEWEKLEVRDCQRIYSKDLEGLQSHRNLLVVMETGPDAMAKGWIASVVWNDTRFSVHGENSYSKHDSSLENSLWSFATYCEVSRVDSYDNSGSTRCSLLYDVPGLSVLDKYTLEDWGEGAFRDTPSLSWLSSPVDDSDLSVEFQTSRIKYCLSEPYSAPCKVYVSNCFLLVTMVCILLGCTCSALISHFCRHEDMCQSLGDALQVFLKEGDAFAQMPVASPAGIDSESMEPASTRWTPVDRWKEDGPRLSQAISRRLWLCTYVPIGTLLLGGSTALAALGKNISQVPNPLFCKPTQLRLTSLKVRLYPWGESQQ